MSNQCILPADGWLDPVSVATGIDDRKWITHGTGHMYGAVEILASTAKPRSKEEKKKLKKGNGGKRKER